MRSLLTVFMIVDVYLDRVVEIVEQEQIRRGYTAYNGIVRSLDEGVLRHHLPRNRFEHSWALLDVFAMYLHIQQIFAALLQAVPPYRALNIHHKGWRGLERYPKRQHRHAVQCRT